MVHTLLQCQGARIVLLLWSETLATSIVSYGAKAYFPPQDPCVSYLIQEIRQAEREVRMQAYYLTSSEIITKLAA